MIQNTNKVAKKCEPSQVVCYDVMYVSQHHDVKNVNPNGKNLMLNPI